MKAYEGDDLLLRGSEDDCRYAIKSAQRDAGEFARRRIYRLVREPGDDEPEDDEPVWTDD